MVFDANGGGNGGRPGETAVIPAAAEKTSGDYTRQPIKLDMEVILRSKEPISEDKEDSIYSVGSVYILIKKGGTELVCFDRTGKKLLSTSNMSLKRPEHTAESITARANQLDGKSYGNQWVATDPAKESTDLPRRHLPVALRQFYDKNGSKGWLEWSKVRPELDKTAAKNLLADKYSVSLIDGRYLLLSDPQRPSSFLVWDTRDKNDREMAAEDWVRTDLWDSYDDTTKAPDPVIKFLDAKNKESDKGGYSFSINAQDIVAVTNNKVAILRNGESVFSETIGGVNRSIASNGTEVFFTQQDNPAIMFKLSLEGDPNTWEAQETKWPKQYPIIKNLQMDRTGSFLIFESDVGVVIVDKIDLEEVGVIEGAIKPNISDQNQILVLDKEGHFVSYEVDFKKGQGQLDQRKVERLAKGISASSIFDRARGRKQKVAAADADESLKPFESYRAEWVTATNGELASVVSLEGIDDVREGLMQLKVNLSKKGLPPVVVDYIIGGCEEAVKQKEAELASQQADAVIVEVEGLLAGNLSLNTIGDARSKLDTLKRNQSLLPEAARKRVLALGGEISERAGDFFTREKDVIIQAVKDLIVGVTKELEELKSKPEFEEWQDRRLSAYSGRLKSLRRDCPIEAPDALAAIRQAETELLELEESYQKKFTEQYSSLRELAVEKISSQVEAARTDIEQIVKRVKTRGFKSRKEVEHYLESDPQGAYPLLLEEIAAIEKTSPDDGIALTRQLKSTLSVAIAGIERQQDMGTNEAGQQVAFFGKETFPISESRKEKKVEHKVQLVFIPLNLPKQAGARASEIMGDVGVEITDAKGKRVVRLWETSGKHEDSYRLGADNKAIPPSYVSKAEFDEISKVYKDWGKDPEKSKIRQELAVWRQETLADLWRRRREAKAAGVDMTELDAEKDEKMESYLNFYKQKNIALFKRIDSLVNAEEEEYKNGSGNVPSWKAHWVYDADAEKNLEMMARYLNIQLKNERDLLNLVGHAGSGKDVYIKMFCHLTNRQYFATDCTKWTTEFELAEDVVLEVEDGASKTVKVPSAVLRGIQTPGAVVYFNEINGMPEQSQIFLHRLLDESRSLTLKTSSGRTIHAAKGVLLVSSMNPGYPGTFDPQEATKSRMVSMHVEYPSLTREKDPGDPNPNPPYNSSEPLRVARETKSLSDLTFDSNIKSNEFVLMWDKYVNGINNGAPEPTEEQKFDIDTILALVQFGDKIRGEFIKNFEKTRDAKTALPATQPFTGRELARCAFIISKMSLDEKTKISSVQLARNLIKEFYLTNIYKKTDREKIEQAMTLWDAPKRLAA